MSEAPSRPLGDYFMIERGATYKSALLGLPGPVLLGLGTIRRHGGFRDDSLTTYGGESPDRMLVSPGDLYASLKDVTQSADLLGAVARLPRDVVGGRLTQDTVKLVPTAADSPLDYLYWVLRTPEYRDYCFEHATGTTTLGLRREDFLAFKVPEPTRTRLHLAELLTALEDKIALNRRMNHTLEATAVSLFRSWFVDFDPVVAKAEGRRSAGVSSSVHEIFPATFTMVGELPFPSGWRVQSVSDFILINPTRRLSNGTLAPYLDMAGAPTVGHAPDNWIFRPAGSGARFMNGDTLLARITPCLENGKTAFVDFLHDGEVAWGSTEFIVLRPVEPIPPVFAYLLARWNEFRDHAERSMTGSSGRQRVALDSLAAFKLVLPPDNIALAFGEIVTPLFARIAANMSENRTLAALRDTLLPQLFSGAIRLRDAERAVSATV
jgi:type I restriction enzyme S subunit